jgi:hypothetical protein
MNDAPLIEIIEDLFRATGVKFGSPSLEWFFSFGENSKFFISPFPYLGSVIKVLT